MKTAPRTASAGDITWTRPWYQPWRVPGQAVAADVARGTPVWQALNRHTTAPVRFVPHTELPPGAPHEQFIARTGLCPTREGLHDFFNGMCWHLFPAAKLQLNALQADLIARDGIQATRGTVRDALTVFDENAALLHAPDALWRALADKDWQRLFVDLRALWREARLELFGHALLEKLHHPRKPITAHVLRMPGRLQGVAAWDAWIADSLRHGPPTPGPFEHLPLLGVPGWWAANDDPDFYRDPQVFRPRGMQGGGGLHAADAESGGQGAAQPQ